ncbi:MAG: AraC family transcriptional regulator [Verrucomicrobia bacterium]|nr:AraC family transcriptional regulator [Verrucomicrobiota bacterium]
MVAKAASIVSSGIAKAAGAYILQPVRGAKERIEVPSGHSFRLLSWREKLSEVYCHTASGQRVRIPGEGSRWHFHLEMELTLFTSGRGTRCVGDHVEEFQEGDLVLLGERLPHCWLSHRSSSGISVQWHFPQGHPFWGFPETLPLGPLFKKAARGIRLIGDTRNRVRRWMEELPHGKPPSQLGSLLLILAQIAEAPPKEVDLLSKRAFDLPLDGQQREALSRVMIHIAANFRAAVPLEDLLVMTDMSRATFARQFKRYSGRTFSDFLNQLRLKSACQELKESNHSVIDIAYASGFSQISFFNRLFQRVMHCTPTQFRKREKES